MQKVMEVFLTTLVHNVWYLAAGVLVAAIIEAVLDRRKVVSALARSGWAGVIMGTAVGAFTPLCSCGTTAVMLGLVAAGVPWPPVVAFLVSSPLMSPSTYALTAGVLGVEMANAKLISAVALGLVSGGVAILMQQKGIVSIAAETTGARAATAGCCSTKAEAAGTPSGDCDQDPSTPPACGCAARTPVPAGAVMAKFLVALRNQAAFILRYFVLYSLAGALAQALVPPQWVNAVFGAGRPLSVVTAAVLGIPLYMSGAASIPLTGSLVGMGMSRGAALSFLISGPGTHFGALAAVAVVTPRPIWWLYLSTILGGAVLAGLMYSLV